jgi:hypothetical protein
MTHKGIAGIAVLIAIGALLAIGSAGYFYTRSNAPTPPEVKEEGPAAVIPVDGGIRVEDISPDILNNKKIATVFWKLENAGPEGDVLQRTKVAIVFRGVEHEIGIYNGGCVELGRNPGVDGKGLLIKDGELAAVQCWYGGGGDEIAVFKDADGFSLRVGELGEGEEGAGIFRGNFTTKFNLD